MVSCFFLNSENIDLEEAKCLALEQKQILKRHLRETEINCLFNTMIFSD
jgi:hypothetical protein